MEKRAVLKNYGLLGAMLAAMLTGGVTGWLWPAAAGTVRLARHHHEHVGYVGTRDELLLAIERPAALRCRRIVRPQPRHVAACTGLGQCEGRLACAAS